MVIGKDVKNKMTLTKEQKEKLQTEISNYIMDNPKNYIQFIRDSVEFVVSSWDENELIQTAKSMELVK
jgi:hypothetical protein